MPDKKATLYRMHTDEHICPFGIKSRDLLEREGFQLEDHLLKTRQETDAFKKKHDVDTTPQTWIDGDRIGGYDDLREYFGKSTPDKDETSYQPVAAVFGVAALLALAGSWVSLDDVWTIRSAEWFVAFSMSMLAMLKLQDLRGFSNRFITYDLLGRKWVRYAYIYPFAELFAGVGMVAMIMPLMPVVIATAFLIGTIGAVSVFKAVYIEGRDLKCACVGGDANVPLGFISLTENLFMIGMAIWMTLKL